MEIILGVFVAICAAATLGCLFLTIMALVDGEVGPAFIAFVIAAVLAGLTVHLAIKAMEEPPTDVSPPACTCPCAPV